MGMRSTPATATNPIADEFKREGSYVHAIFDIVRNAVLRELGGGAEFSRGRARSRGSGGASFDAERQSAHRRDHAPDVAD